MISRAWGQVTSDTINHCFAKAKFCHYVPQLHDEPNDNLAPLFNVLSEHHPVPSASLTDYLSMDSQLNVCGE